MTLSPLASPEQSGEIVVDATKHSDLPGLKNNTSKELRISFSATGTWCLYNVPTKDPGLAVFNAQTDWKGYQLPKATHEKYKWRQADAPAGALLVEIFDAQGARKAVLASPASVDLAPGGSLTFVVNDDPAWYVNNSGLITLSYKSISKDSATGLTTPSVAPATPSPATTQATVKLVVPNFGYIKGNWRVEHHPRFVADLTGDGRSDIIGFGFDGVVVALNKGDGTFGNPYIPVNNFNYHGGWRVENHPRFVADLTGDGRADIVGFGNAGVLVALNNGDGTFSAVRRVVDYFGYDAAWRVEKHPRFLADLTGDGRADIIGFGEDGVYVALNNGAGSFGDVRKVLSVFAYNDTWRVAKHPRLLADLTGDGRADIVGFGEDGVYVALNNGNGSFGDARKVLSVFAYNEAWRVEKHPRFLADLTGDGRADIVAFGEDGVYLALNNGNGTFGDAQRVVGNFSFNDGWRVEKHPRFVTELTGDGKADIIGFWDDGVYVSLNKGQGTF